VLIARVLGESAGGLADDLEMVNHPHLDQFVVVEGCAPFAGMALDAFDGFEDVFYTVGV
jgi:hypothetical protein